MKIVEILLPPGISDKSLSPKHIKHIDMLQRRMDAYTDKIKDPNTSPAAREFLKAKLRTDLHDLKSTIRTVTEQGLTELFKPTGNWEWTFQGSEEVSAEFKVGKNVYVFYAYTSDPIEANWDVEFKMDTVDSDVPREKRFALTGTGNSAEVFANVVDIMRSFLTKYKDRVDVLTFSASEPSRKKLYQRMVQRLLPAWELSVEGNDFIARKPKYNKQPVKEAVHKLPLSNDDFELVKELMCRPIPAAIAPIYIHEIIEDDEFNDLLTELEKTDPGRDVRPLIVEWFRRVMPDQLYRFTGAEDTMQRKQGLLSPIHGYDPHQYKGTNDPITGNAYGRA